MWDMYRFKQITVMNQPNYLSINVDWANDILFDGKLSNSPFHRPWRDHVDIISRECLSR
jgi:hypothetical protein